MKPNNQPPIYECRIGNFKAFGPTQRIPMRRITLIFGPNSSGKSSILHALTLLAEASQADDTFSWDIKKPKLGRGLVDLGGIKTYRHRPLAGGGVVLGINKVDYEIDLETYEYRNRTSHRQMIHEAEYSFNSVVEVDEMKLEAIEHRKYSEFNSTPPRVIYGVSNLNLKGEWKNIDPDFDDELQDLWEEGRSYRKERKAKLKRLLDKLDGQAKTPADSDDLDIDEFLHKERSPVFMPEDRRLQNFVQNCCKRLCGDQRFFEPWKEYESLSNDELGWDFWQKILWEVVNRCARDNYLRVQRVDDLRFKGINPAVKYDATIDRGFGIVNFAAFIRHERDYWIELAEKFEDKSEFLNRKMFESKSQPDFYDWLSDKAKAKLKEAAARSSQEHDELMSIYDSEYRSEFYDPDAEDANVMRLAEQLWTFVLAESLVLLGEDAKGKDLADMALEYLFRPGSVNEGVILCWLGDHLFENKKLAPPNFTVDYLGPLRAYPEREIRFESELNDSPCADGSDLYQMLFRSDSVLMETNYALGPQGLDTDYLIGVHSFSKKSEGVNFGAESLQEGFYEISTPAKAQMEDRYLKIFSRDSGVELSARDIGQGMSQVLPVVVSLLGKIEQHLPYQSKISLIEQPELHLHPAQQAKLADVCILATKREIPFGARKQLILETHSEHLILRLLRRIKETSCGGLPEHIPPLEPDDISVLYVLPGTERKGSRVIHIPVNQEGEFTRPWPGGFFPERLDELLG